MEISDALLCGLEATHIEALEDGTRLHRDALPAFRRLRAKASEAGFDLRVASGFRDFAAQCRIWNEKCEGKRPLLDSSGRPLDAAKLSPRERVHAILRWSALPGASRHHWGTDFDVYDARSLPEGYRLQLVPAEIAPGGVLFAFGQWLETALAEHGFFRPYREDRGGVSPEWWHLSYAPLSVPFLKAFSVERLRKVLERSTLLLKDVVLAELPALYDRYVLSITLPA